MKKHQWVLVSLAVLFSLFMTASCDTLEGGTVIITVPPSKLLQEAIINKENRTAKEAKTHWCFFIKPLQKMRINLAFLPDLIESIALRR